MAPYVIPGEAKPRPGIQKSLVFFLDSGQSLLAFRNDVIGDTKNVNALPFFAGTETRPTLDKFNTLRWTCEADRFARTQAHVLELLFGDQNT